MVFFALFRTRVSQLHVVLVIYLLNDRWMNCFDAFIATITNKRTPINIPTRISPSLLHYWNLFASFFVFLCSSYWFFYWPPLFVHCYSFFLSRKSIGKRGTPFFHPIFSFHQNAPFCFGTTIFKFSSNLDFISITHTTRTCQWTNYTLHVLCGFAFFTFFSENTSTRNLTKITAIHFFFSRPQAQITKAPQQN